MPTYKVRSRFKGYYTKKIQVGGWHKIEAKNIREAKNKFRKGTNFKLNEIQVKKVSSKR